MCEDMIRLAGACYETDPPSGVLWLNDMPGLSLSNVAAVTPSDALSAAEMVRTKERAARRVLSALLRSKLREKRVLIDRDAEIFAICNKGSAVVTSPAGIRVNWQFRRSILSRFYIDRLIFYPASDGLAVVEIKDMAGAVLFSEEVGAAAGAEIVINVGKSIEEGIFYITADGVDLYSVSCSSGCYIAIAEAVPGTGPAGFGICGGVECTTKNVFCHFYECLSSALLYQTAAEVAKEIAAPGRRFNCFADTAPEWAAEMAATWETEAAGFIDAEIGGIVDKLRRDPCFECRNDLRCIPILPA